MEAERSVRSLGKRRHGTEAGRRGTRPRASERRRFFFKQKTAYDMRGDWSSDVCSSDHDAFFFQAEDGIRDESATGVQTCALPISSWTPNAFNRAANFAAVSATSASGC